MINREATMTRDRTDPDHEHAEPRIPGGFRAAFSTAIVEAGFSVKEWQGTSLICLDGKGEERTLSLGNVYKRCQNAPRADWGGIIGEFVKHMASATREAAMPDRLEDAVDNLFIRIGMPFPKSLGEGVPWNRPVGDTGLVMNLVVDHPHFVSYVATKLIEESGQDADHWVDIARENLRKRTPPDYLAPVEEGGGIMLGCCNDAYDAARALILDQIAPDESGFGWFVAVPTRDVMIVLPVNGETLVNIHVLKRFAVDNCKSRPYPISDEVYWVMGRRWHRFDVTVTDEAVQVTPPPEFLPILLQINPEVGEGDEEMPAQG